MPFATFGGFRIRKGQVPGSKHLKLGINNQDALCLGEQIVGGFHYYVGLVSDGCTNRDNPKGSKTEIGSALLTQFAFSEIRRLLAANISLREVPERLYQLCVAYIGNVARATVFGSPDEMWDFIQRHFLATLLGFIVSDTELVTFSAGDGVFVVNDSVVVINENNSPFYLAYHQLDPVTLRRTKIALPSTFETNVFDVKEVNRFAVSSDGLVQQNQQTGLSDIPKDVVDSLFDYSPQAPAGLQWWLNKQRNAGAFADDTTVITLSR